MRSIRSPLRVTSQAVSLSLKARQQMLTRERKNAMAQTFAKSFYNTRAWQKCRNAYIKKRLLIDGGLCEECHDAQGYIVHHKVTLTEENIDDVNVTLNERNLKYVCKDCHDAYEGHGAGGHGKAKALCTFDAFGNPISSREIDRQRGDGVRPVSPPIRG